MASPTHAASTAFPPFESATFASQLLWVTISFAVLYFLMSRIALPRIAKVMEDRQNRITADLAEAQKLRAESEEAVAAYEKALAEARANAQAIAQKARDEMAAEFEAKRKALEADLAAQIAAAEETIRANAAAAMANVRDIAAEAASAIVERLTGVAPERAEVEAALNRAA
ncbi:F0F1 ATP synthase subunit B' [Camelimonas abortus]|uniref:ATP synthase subunit b n=1 Tax=Camelimonas abortus TaxID=1017184 RepID=A0ABV7LE62_9HYPH